MKSIRKKIKFSSENDILFPEKKGKKNYSLKNKNNEIDFDPAESSGKIRLSFQNTNFHIFSFLIALLALVIIVRLGWLQIIIGQSSRALADGNRLKTLQELAPRGLIYDRHEKPLVQNEPAFQVIISPKKLAVDQVPSIARALANITDQNPDKTMAEINKILTTARSEKVLAAGLTHAQAIAFNAMLGERDDIFLQIRPKRNYLNPTAFSHVLGYTGTISKEELDKLPTDESRSSLDQVGKTGIELIYEKLLRGKDRVVELEVDAFGNESGVVQESKKNIGHDLYLSLDADLQQKLNQTLNIYSRAVNAKKAAAIALNPKTGEVLALVSLPNYDNNLFTKSLSDEDFASLFENPDEPLFNRAVMGSYPSGSTIKPIFAAAALQEGVIKRNTTVNSTGGLQVNAWFFPDWKTGGHGRTNVVKAIAESVNTFFYTIGGGFDDFTGLGVEFMKKYSQLFGLGQPTNIDLPFEESGFLPSPEWKEEVKDENWYIGDTYHFAIGQGDVLVTPIQIASATAYFANGGTLWQPYILNLAKNELGEIVYQAQSVKIRENIVKTEFTDLVRQGLRQSVTSGGARGLAGTTVPSAGKTGTAQVGGDAAPHAWFTGFAPYENPDIVLTVIIENGGGGSNGPLSVFRDVINWYFGGR